MHLVRLQRYVSRRVRLAEAITECGGAELVEAVLQLFRQIFVYSPQARPTAKDLKCHHFWSARLY